MTSIEHLSVVFRAYLLTGSGGRPWRGSASCERSFAKATDGIRTGNYIMSCLPTILFVGVGVDCDEAVVDIKVTGGLALYSC